MKINQDFLDFVNIIDNNSCSTRIGFDACFVPMLMHFTEVDIKYIDPCECSFFSVYIDENLRMSSCIFSNNINFTYSIKEYSVEYIWTVLFDKYRHSLNNNCLRVCKNKNECRGHCPDFDCITMCYSSVRAEGLSYAS